MRAPMRTFMLSFRRNWMPRTILGGGGGRLFVIELNGNAADRLLGNIRTWKACEAIYSRGLGESLLSRSVGENLGVKRYHLDMWRKFWARSRGRTRVLNVGTRPMGGKKYTQRLWRDQIWPVARYGLRRKRMKTRRWMRATFSSTTREELGTKGRLKDEAHYFLETSPEGWS
jgi:hypothetical protein